MRIEFKDFLNPVPPMLQRIAAECGKCDQDQCNLCEKCPNKIDVEKLILQCNSDLRDLKNVARLALTLTNSKDMVFCAEQFARIVHGVRQFWRRMYGPEQAHDEQTFITNHPIVRYVTILLRNRACPNHEITFPRLHLQVTDIAEVE